MKKCGFDICSIFYSHYYILTNKYLFCKFGYNYSYEWYEVDANKLSEIYMKVNINPNYDRREQYFPTKQRIDSWEFWSSFIFSGIFINLW